MKADACAIPTREYESRSISARLPKGHPSRGMTDECEQVAEPAGGSPDWTDRRGVREVGFRVGWAMSHPDTLLPFSAMCGNTPAKIVRAADPDVFGEPINEPIRFEQVKSAGQGPEAW